MTVCRGYLGLDKPHISFICGLWWCWQAGSGMSAKAGRTPAEAFDQWQMHLSAGIERAYRRDVPRGTSVSS